MKVYLVGGAVRDQFLGYPVKERDWVVVGGTPDALLHQGFSQVGRDFPVFLHPKTREEYALARTERKSSVGYYGFTCDFNPKVTLKEDLARRDLTINAMAMDDDGTLIDPYHGLDDLRARLFRHVSPAFIEDPVRVLRVARFAARYHHLGFSIADETLGLMTEMVKRGELSHLVPERVWQEFSRSLGERNPEQFIAVLRACGALQVVIPEIEAPALDALEKMAVKTDSPVLRFAALLYNLGGEPDDCSSIETMSARLRIPKEYTHLACLTAQYYRQLQALQEMDAEHIVQLLERCDAFRRPQIFEQLLMISDAIAQHSSQRHASQWLIIYEICGKISTKSLIDQGLKGEAIKKGLHQKRVNNVEAWISHEKK